MRRTPSTAIFTCETVPRRVAVSNHHVNDATALACGASDLTRLRTCQHCGNALSPHAELFLVGDAVFCSTAHRASAVMLDRDVAAGLEAHAYMSHARRVPTATGVGLAASHRSWCMDFEDPDRSSSGRGRASGLGSSGFIVGRGSTNTATLSC